jgi:hypothetical protein
MMLRYERELAETAKSSVLAISVTGPKPSGVISYVVREPTLIHRILLGSVLVHSAALLLTHASLST